MRTNIGLTKSCWLRRESTRRPKPSAHCYEEALAAFIAMKEEEKRSRTYKERLQSLRAKTASVRLRSDTRTLLRQDRDSR